MMEAEMDDHLGYEKSERSGSDDHRNGYKEKTVNSNYGSVRIEVPQDRKSTYEPKVVKKRQKDISEIDQKIISMYAKGMTTRQISDTLMDIYPVLFIDAVHYSVRDNGIIRKLAAYVILGISCCRPALPAGRRAGHLYDQRHRENLRRIQKAEQTEKRVSKRSGSSESPLSGRI